ncbi:MAG: STAS domain-containing protein [Verrucomicrobia bacterium]|nr:STAS domain-containing protein [Verrucomicrobiota bacterium]
MTIPTKTGLPEILEKYETGLLADWLKEQTALAARQQFPFKEGELKLQCSEFLRLMRKGTQSNNPDISTDEWIEMRELLTAVSSSRAQQGFTPSQTAAFVFSFKKPLFERLRKEYTDAAVLATETWTATSLLDDLGLFTTEIYQKTREEVILRQNQGLLELSTPVVMLWEGILALPLIGTLDSARSELVMQSLLFRIVETGASIAIIDITGVPTVDTLVAQHLLKTVTAARLMGANCFISGIRPQIAQTIVHLGVDLSGITTKANLKDALALAMKQSGLTVVNTKKLAKDLAAA